MAVVKTTKKGYKSTKTGTYHSSKSAAIKADKSASSSSSSKSKSGGGSSSSSAPTVITSGSRQEMLDNALKIAGNIQSMLSDPSTKLTQKDIDSLSSSISSASAGLSKASAPTNPAQMSTPLGEVKLPDLTPAPGDITDATAGMSGLDERITQMRDAYLKEAERQMAAAEAMQTEQTSLFEKWFGKDGKDSPSPTETRENAWDETGIDVADYFSKQEAGLKEIESLTEQYNATVEARDMQIAQTRDTMGSMNFINNQIAQIERNSAPTLSRMSANINAKAATLQAQQGNFTEAQKYVNQAVQDAISDFKFKYDMYSMFYDMNEDAFERTQGAYKDAFLATMTLAEAEYERAYAEKQQIAEWMLKYPNAGISITDSLEEAARKGGASVGNLSGVSSEAKRRAKQVIAGQASLSDFTPAAQADIRDAIWSMSASEAGFTGNMSYADPTYLLQDYDSRRMEVAGPGSGSASTGLFDMTEDERTQLGLSWLNSQQAPDEDFDNFKSDTAFRAWVIEQAASSR